MQGDLLSELDGVALTDATDLLRAMTSERIGQTVEAIVVRGGEPRTLRVILEELVSVSARGESGIDLAARNSGKC